MKLDWRCSVCNWLYEQLFGKPESASSSDSHVSEHSEMLPGAISSNFIWHYLPGRVSEIR